MIIGYGPEKIHLQNFINKNNLKKIVKIIFVKNPYKYIKMSDVFILSSKYEGLPNVLLEAAVLKKFIITNLEPAERNQTKFIFIVKVFLNPLTFLKFNT